jgi:tetratricopeptide (TPR) repeat protein
MGPILYSAFVAEQGSGRYSASVIPVAELPVAALSRPRHTLTVAERVLARSADPTERSYAGHARGIALREIGDVRAAVRQLTVSLQDAARAGAAREADVAATLAVTLVVAGRSRQGMAQFERALGKVSGASAARIRVRRGSMLGELGRPLEAAVELRAAARTLRRAGDSTWEARALLNLAQAHIEVGDTQHARVALVRAEQLLAGSEHTYEAAVVRQDRGTVAILEGQIAEALTHFDVAEERLAEAGNDSAELSELRVVALLSAGLFGDAAASAEDAVAQLRRPGASAARRAHALVRASEAALAVGDVKMARRRLRKQRARSGGRGSNAAGRRPGCAARRPGAPRVNAAPACCTSCLRSPRAPRGTAWSRRSRRTCWPANWRSTCTIWTPPASTSAGPPEAGRTGRTSPGCSGGGRRHCRRRQAVDGAPCSMPATAGWRC